MSASMSQNTKAEPNLTPLLDVVFQLITFFMLLINFSNDNYDLRIKLPVAGSARPLDVADKAAAEVFLSAYAGTGATGWFALSDATVYFDHPQHARAEHTLNIDFLNPGQGPAARVAVELTAESARSPARAIETTLASAPPGLA